MDGFERFDELCHSYLTHSGVKNMRWRQHDPNKRWQSHAVYAQGMPNPDAKVRGWSNVNESKSRMSTQNVPDPEIRTDKGMPQYGRQTFNDLKKLSGPPNYNSRMEINHPSSENGSDAGRHHNCPNCAAAFDMQERGYDVIARPSKNGSNVGDIESMFKDGDLRSVHHGMSPRVISKLVKLYDTVETSYGRSGQKAWNKYNKVLDAQQKLTTDLTIQAIKSQGTNSRGIIVVGWMDDPTFKTRTTSYHAFNYKTQKGVVTFYDVQSKKKEKVNGFSVEQAEKDFFRDIDPREVYLMRTSDVEPSERIMSAVYSPDRSLKHSYLTSQEILGKFKMMMGANL